MLETNFKLLPTLQEFVELGWSGVRENPIKDDISIDTKLKPLLILRKTKNYYTIYSLSNGCSIIIPWNLIEFFDSLNVFAGDRILRMKDIEGNTIDEFIINFIKASSYLETQRFDEYLQCISNICIEKSSEFRNWIRKNYNIILDPIKFSSPKNLYEL